MNRHELHTDRPEATHACGERLASFLRPRDVILLAGDLGAGKTMLTKGIAAGLHVGVPVTSPTFNMLLVYEGDLPLYHFDLYRLDQAGQLEEIDYHATLEADGVSVVEWGDRFPERAPTDGLVVTITLVGDESRCMDLSPLGSRGAEIADAWAASCASLDGVTVGAVQ